MTIGPAHAKVHNRTKNFIDIEVPASDVLVYCFHMNPEEKRSLMVFYALDGKKTRHEFVYRRLWDADDCNAEERAYRKLLQRASSVRVVGIRPNEPEMERGTDLPPNAAPKFKELMESIFWSFVRLQTKKGCKAYFEEDCLLPKNYWGGISPE